MFASLEAKYGGGHKTKGAKGAKGGGKDGATKVKGGGVSKKK